MALTGTGISFSNPGFGTSESFARAAASDGSTAFSFGTTQGYRLNTSNGNATSSQSAFGGTGQIRGATYNGTDVLVYIDSYYVFSWESTPGGGFSASPVINNVRYQSGSGFTGNPSINGFAYHNGNLYVTDGNTDRLFTLGSNGELSTVGNSYTNRVIGGMTSHNGQLLGADNTNDRLVVFNTTTGQPSPISSNALPGSRTVDFLLSHNGNLYGAWYADGLFRFYDVEWDSGIADLSYTEGDSDTVDLDAISTDADTFSLGGSPPSWLSISGDNLVITNAGPINQDTNYPLEILATRDSISDTLNINLALANVNTAPSWGQASYSFTGVGLAVNTVVGTVTATDPDTADSLTYSLTGADATNFDISSTGEITVSTALSYGQTYNFEASVTDGTATVNVNVSVAAAANVAPAFGQASYTFSDIAIAVNTVVGSAVATDANNDTITYTLIGADASNFDIDSNGQITVTTALSYGTTYNFQARASDSLLTTDVNVAVSTAAVLAFSDTIADQDWIVGIAVNMTLPEATGGGTKTYSLTPSLPGGIMFNAGTRVLSGLPNMDFAQAAFTYTVTDGTQTATLNFNVQVTFPETNILQQTQLPQAN